MFQSLVMTGLTPLCYTNELQNWDNMPFNGNWPQKKGISVSDCGVKKPITKKPKRVRTAYSTDQIRALEKIYSTSKYIDAKRRKQLTKTLKIGDKALKIWFQNRRMKEKKETSESSSDTSDITCPSPNLSKDCVEQQVDDNPSQNHNESYESQYQLPTFCYQDGAPGLSYQNGHLYEPNGASFGVDTYPTQYYPLYNHYNSIDSNGYSQLQNAYGTDSWYAGSYDFNYYSMQQA